MGQVPTNSPLPILLVGSGRLATHLAHYLQQLDVQFTVWSRKSNLPDELSTFFLQPHRVLLAISDSALEEFVRRPWHEKSALIHFSGAATLPGTFGFHPLMSFGLELYDLETYLQIPFISDSEYPSFNDLLPELPNTSFTIKPDQKAFYHALCVLSGNLTVWLWQRVAQEFQTKLNLPSSVLHLYREQIFKNLQTNFEKALTGPLIRGDWRTVVANIKALESSSLESLYLAFVKDFIDLVPIHESKEVEL